MKRSLIQLNDTTYAITLPSKWIKENSLSKKDYLDLQEAEGRLVVSVDKPAKQHEKSQIDLNLSECPIKAAWFSITSSYIAGFDIIEAKISPKIKPHVEEIAKNLIGSALISVSDTHATFACVSEAREEFQEDVLNNLIFRFRQHVSSVKDARTSKEKSDFEQKDHELNKFVFYSLRALNKKKEQDKTKYLLVYSLEQICDSISESVARDTKMPNWKKLEDIFMQISNLYFSRQWVKAQEIYIRIKELISITDNNAEKQILLKMKETIQILSPYMLFGESSGSA